MRTPSQKAVNFLFLSAINLVLAVAPNADAQTAAAQSAPGSESEGVSVKLPEFEVATVKSVDPSVAHVVGVKIYPGARIVISAVPLKTLISTAFRLSYWQVSGGGAWIENDRYDVEAKPPENLRPSIKDLRYTWYGIEDARLREMLQKLLIDRFQLKFHRETKTGNVYLLRRSGKTLRLKPTDAPSAFANASGGAGSTGSVGFAGGRWVIFNTAMPQLAKFAADYVLRAPVLDRTELSGSFDYKQQTRLDDSEANYSDPSDSFLRLIPELGLELKPSKGPVEVFVVDHAARPSSN
jgi:uncharacterized protein (TIGR03435 family)